MARKATASLLREEQEPYRARRSSDAIATTSQLTAGSAKILPLARKASGAYYTPEDVVRSLTRWVIRSTSDRLLDPACGDGRFIAEHRNSVGVDQDLIAVARAAERACHAVVHHADFFEW